MLVIKFVLKQVTRRGFVKSISSKHHSNEGYALECRWQQSLAAYEKSYPKEAFEFNQLISGKLPREWESTLPVYFPNEPGDAGRNLSQACLNALCNVLPGLIGGSADLTSLCMTLMDKCGIFQRNNPAERNVLFGVREHGMGAICNGIALHASGLIPYCATFFVFTDYMRAAMRNSAIYGVGVIYIMTHDSIAIGENGPTHQPIEHLACFRAMPNILTLRPADGNEVSGAYRIAIFNRNRPSILVLSKQQLPHLVGTSVERVAKGAYVISDNSSDNNPDVIIMGTGSELEIAVKAADVLRNEGISVRVISMVCWELFEEQSDVYKESVLPRDVDVRVSIEAATTIGWIRYVGHKGRSIGINRFGASAPPHVLYLNFGFTVDAIVSNAKELLNS